MAADLGSAVNWSPEWIREWAPEMFEASVDPYLNLNFFQDVDMDTEELAIYLKKGMFSELHSVVSEIGIPVTATYFDLQKEMLWVGNQRGHVTSFFGKTMPRYSSFQVHTIDDIRHIRSLGTGVLFLSKRNLSCYTRGGVIMFDYPMEKGANMNSLLMTDNNTLLMGGLQNYVTELDLNTIQETQKFTVEVPGVTIMRQTNRSFFCGHPSGKVTQRDLRTLKLEHVFNAFSGGLSDFDVHGNLLAACGFSSLSGLACDRFIMVYDLRMMRAPIPLQVDVDPLFLRFVPTYRSRIAIISATGRGQFCEPTGLANTAEVFHINTNGQLLTSFDVSSSKQALGFGDSGGCVQLWSDAPDISFNVYSREAEFARPCLVDTLIELNGNHDLQPFSLIPTPTRPTARAEPCSRKKMVPAKGPEIQHTVETVGLKSSVKSPRTCRRKQVQRKKNQTPAYYFYHNQVPENPTESDEESLHVVPKKYRKVAIKYSKRGLEDFNFSSYNQTMFAGLEPDIPNAYCNSMIQVLYFLEPIRCLVQNHLCQKEFCLACELGFLFHMLDFSEGDPCQANNFLRAFRNIPDAKALGLILSNHEERTGKAKIGLLIQRWNRFILSQLHQETQEQESESVIGKLFGSEVENRSLCVCGKETVRSPLTLLFNMRYPEHNSQAETIKEYDFAEILKKSICLEQSSQAWCDNCENYQPTVHTRSIRHLPDVLALNCEVNSAKEAEFWKVQAEYAFNKAMQKAAMEASSTGGIGCGTQADDQRHVWIPATLKMSISKNQELEIMSWPESEELSAAEEGEGASLYDLVVTVPHILDDDTGDTLVAHIKVGETYHDRKEGVYQQQWYLFNDFLVEPIDKTEAVQFDVSWKVPAILYYTKRNYHTKYDLHIKRPVDASVMHTEASLTQRKTDATFMPLMDSEKLQAGDLVGLDAEFVMLRQEETELRSNGTKSTIKPSYMSVARITCVRVQGPNKGIPFIDDYISTQEQVVDYLTQYSGIRPGDLDAKISSKHLTTLKSTYLKLRFLIDSGVRFVGHGLQNDFRVINLMVNKFQINDTVQMFRLPRKRMISLKFLAWYFLGINIQGKTHDSTEDACTALELYTMYGDILREGGFAYLTEVIQKLYETGFQLNWKIPDSDMKWSQTD
ncbi:PAN2-PAN3 deadenylation complex catalytic subunit PAN2-like [Archocentrus centrarchus]|uniref:PAN2-PAN3 deadenylation complex catalytic subunit PAN2-like n=1 Tax=Archocentrus centrarchus TaxID=63155 RepID=UPI0011EA1A78|nr:PAN2-PAN3 deadenylation complex catalytic subunit PAN2-like [Archocentrus centrarchus]